MRIAVEGMDGSGKTTLSKILVNRLGYEYVDKPFIFKQREYSLRNSMK